MLGLQYGSLGGAGVPMCEAVQQGMAIMYPAASASEAEAEAAAPGGGAAATTATAVAGEQEAAAAAAAAEATAAAAGPSDLRAQLRSFVVGAQRRKGYHGQASKVWSCNVVVSVAILLWVGCLSAWYV